MIELLDFEKEYEKLLKQYDGLKDLGSFKEVDIYTCY